MIVKRSNRRPCLTFTHALLVAFGAAVASATLSTSAAARGAQSFTVRSTLPDNAVLTHRIRWLGLPSLSASEVAEVDFMIDGTKRWVELHPPYTYGYNGNYLVTTWLAPGPHRFTVTAISTDHRRATTSSTARVVAAPPPPSALVGSWTRAVTKDEAGNSGRPGTWRLTVDRVGWRVLDPTHHGALVDVAYLSATVLEARGGIATKNHDSHEGNIWCDEPFQPVRYRWTVDGDTLTLALAGPKRCDGQSDVWAGAWSRA